MLRAASVFVAFLLASALVVSVTAQDTAKKAPAPKANVAPATPSAPAEPEGMVKIFNGKDLSEWDGDPRLWSVKDGAIHGETTKENPTKGNTFIIWKGGLVGDFELRLSYRMHGGNSGVQYRSKHLVDHKDNKWVVSGYQAECANAGGRDGFIYGEKTTGQRMCLVGEKVVWKDAPKKEDQKQVVGKVGDAAAIAASFKPDQWNDYVIIAKGNHIVQYLNGVQTVDFTDESKTALKKGIIALQIHAGGPMWVEFKDLRVKKLD